MPIPEWYVNPDALGALVFQAAEGIAGSYPELNEVFMELTPAQYAGMLEAGERAARLYLDRNCRTAPERRPIHA